MYQKSMGCLFVKNKKESEFPSCDEECLSVMAGFEYGSGMRV